MNSPSPLGDHTVTWVRWSAGVNMQDLFQKGCWAAGWWVPTMRESREAGEDLALAPVHRTFPVGQTWDSQPSDRGFWKFLHPGSLSVLPPPPVVY